MLHQVHFSRSKGILVYRETMDPGSQSAFVVGSIELLRQSAKSHCASFLSAQFQGNDFHPVASVTICMCFRILKSIVSYFSP